MSGVAAKSFASAVCRVHAVRPASGPYTSATIGESTGGPGGTSTTFTAAPWRFAIASSAGRTDAAISWLLRSRWCLSTRFTCRSPSSGSARR